MVLQSSGPTWTAMATFTFDVFCPEPEHKACAWRWKAWLVPRRRTSAIANIQHAVRCYPGRVLAYAVMKQLLLLTFGAFASEAMAQDAQCVPERAAMVETIRVYARLEADVLGPQGISESVLEAMGKTQRHRFISERSCSVAYMDAPVLIGPRPDNIAAVHSRNDDPSRGPQVRRYGAGSRHGFRLSGRSTIASGSKDLYR